jgi:hypothetical protein
MKRATENQFLIVNKGVVMTPIIEPVIVALDEYFREANKKAYVTSGLRNPESQLTIIRSYLKNKGYEKHFPDAFAYEVDKMVEDPKHGEIYAWQLGWSKLLNIGVIINPPKLSYPLMDYFRNGINKKGVLINGSPHFKGTAFDIGGGVNGITDETAILMKAMKDGVLGLVNILPERENNANHCDCIKISI